jgi:hypothetical protein
MQDINSRHSQATGGAPTCTQSAAATQSTAAAARSIRRTCGVKLLPLVNLQLVLRLLQPPHQAPAAAHHHAPVQPAPGPQQPGRGRAVLVQQRLCLRLSARRRIQEVKRAQWRAAEPSRRPTRGMAALSWWRERSLRCHCIPPLRACVLLLPKGCGRPHLFLCSDPNWKTLWKGHSCLRERLNKNSGKLQVTNAVRVSPPHLELLHLFAHFQGAAKVGDVDRQGHGTIMAAPILEHSAADPTQGSTALGGHQGMAALGDYC